MTCDVAIEQSVVIDAEDGGTPRRHAQIYELEEPQVVVEQFDELAFAADRGQIVRVESTSARRRVPIGGFFG